MTGAKLARAAMALVGCRFRLHGRDPASGLDCVGVLHAALASCGRSVSLPDTYTLRLRDPAPWLPDPAACGFGPAEPPYAPHTLLNETVQAAKASEETSFQAGFINACLRRFLREQAALMKLSESLPAAQWNYPSWWLHRLQQDYPQTWRAIADAARMTQHGARLTVENFRRRRASGD